MAAQAEKKVSYSFWERSWSIFGSTPIWLKIMGIVLFPILLAGLAAVLYTRQSVYRTIATQNGPVDLNEIFSALTSQAVLVIGLTLVIGVALAYILSRILGHPIRQLLKVMQRVEQGDLSARVHVWAGDEIGKVQEAFNQMTGKLELTQDELLEQNRQLAAVNELAEALTLAKGVDAIMEIALNHILSLMRCNVGSIYLLDHDTGVLRLKASHGYLSPDLMHCMSSTGVENKLMQLMLKTGHAIVIEEVCAAEEQLSEQAQLLSQEGYVSWACAPLKMEGDVIGVFHLGMNTRRWFGSHERDLLEIIGNVVGASLSSAQLLKDLRQKEWELRRALHRSVDLQEDERKRLARELHDEVGQALTSILIRLKTIQEEKDPALVAGGLDDLRQLTSQTIEELRRIAIDLRPAALDSLGIIPALRWYVKQSTDMTGVAIQLEAPDKIDRLSPEVELVLYRVAQEGITNAIRHGKAKRIKVILEKDAQEIRLLVEDNGLGFDANHQPQGLGLIGIRERIEMMDGKFSISGHPGSGSQLSIELPV